MGLFWIEDAVRVVVDYVKVTIQVVGEGEAVPTKQSLSQFALFRPGLLLS